MFPIPGHPVMRPNTGFIELSVGLVFRDFVAPLPEHAAMRAVNRAIDEQRKKKKDDKQKKWRSKQRVKLQRGKRRQGSSKEEEEEVEEEEDDGSMSPIPWDDLATGDEDPPSPQVGPLLRHAMGQEGDDVPLEPAESKRLAPSKPSTVASEPVESGRLALSGPSTAALEPSETGRSAPFEPSVAPSESVGGGRSDSSEPSELREGLKRQCADEEQPRSGKPAPKRPRMMASG